MAIFLLIFILAAALPSVPAQTNLFVVQWGSSVCQASGNTCTGPKTPTEFTTHGLWSPSTGTCPSWLQPSDTQPIIDKLTKSWPNVFYYGVPNPTANYFNFWSNEWRKHGCFYNGLTATQYFNLSVNLYEAVGTLRADISSDECRPGQSCNLARALETYDAKYPNRLPRLVCTVNKNGQDQLQEVRFKVSAAEELEPLGVPRTAGCRGPTALFPFPVTSMLPEEVLPEALFISQIIEASGEISV